MKKNYKLAYKQFVNSLGPDVDLLCPSCGGYLWEICTRTGSKKLPKDGVKLKCSNCGQYFICGKKQVTKVLGQ